MRSLLVAREGYDMVESTKRELLSAKAEEFIADLVEVCKKHNMTITPSGYDSIQVWNADDDHDQWSYDVEDRTD